jgi:hypothetical protein
MAGRSVGTIEVTVDADTGRLKAQLVRAGKEGGHAAAIAIEKELEKLDATIEFSEREIIAETRRARSRIEAALKGINIGLQVNVREELAKLRAFKEEVEQIDLVLHADVSDRDIAEINAKLKALAEQDRDATIQFEADLTAVNTRLRAFLAQQREAEIQFQADLTAINTQLRAFKARQRTDATNLRIEGDLRDLNTSLAAFRRSQEARRVDISFGAELARINAELRAFRARQEADAIELRVEMRRSIADAAGGDGGGIRALFEGMGGDAGDSFERGMSTRMKAIVGLIVTLAEPAAVLLQGTLAAATSVLSSAFSGLGGALGPLPAMFAALGTTVTTLVVGFQGMGDALGAVSEEFASALAEGRQFNFAADGIVAAMRSLTPAARDVVRAFSELSPALSDIRQAVQQKLFAGLGDSLRSLSSDVLPAVSTGLENAAGSLNRFFKELATRTTTIDLKGIFAGLQPIIDDMLDAFLHLFSAIEPFLKAAAPAAQALAQSFSNTAKSLGEMIAAGAASGGLSDFLLAGVDSLREWWALTRNLGDALATIFKAGTASGDSFVKSLSNIVKTWDDWLESVEGQKALFTFFENGRRVMAALKPVLQGLKGFFDELITPQSLSRFEEFADSVGQVLPTLGKLLNMVGQTRILQVFVDVLDAIGDALMSVEPELRALADTIGSVMMEAVSDLRPLLYAMGNALGDLAPILGDVASAAGEAFDSLIDAAKPLVPLVGELAETMGSNLADALRALAPVFNAIADAVSELIGPFGQMTEAISGALVEALGASIPLIELAADALGVLIGFVTTAADVFSALPGPLQSIVVGLLALTAIDVVGFGSKLGNLFKTAQTHIGTFTTATKLAGLAIGDMVKGLATANFTKFTQGVKDLGPALLAAGKGAAAAAGTAIAGALGIAFGVQMVREADGMAGKVAGVLSIVASSAAAFAAGGPILGGITLAMGAITALFQASSSDAKKAAAEIDEYVNAMEGIGPAAQAAAATTVVLANLKDESTEVRERFIEMEFSVRDWATGMVKNTTSVKEGMAQLVESFGPGGAQIAAALRSGKLGVDDFVNAMELSQTMVDGFDLRQLRSEIGSTGISSQEAAKNFDFLRDEGHELELAQKEVALSAQEAGSGLDEEGTAAEGVADAIDPLVALSNRAAVEAAGLGSAGMEAALGLDTEALASENLVNAVGLIPGAEAAAAAAFGATADALEAEKGKMREATEAAEALAEATRDAAIATSGLDPSVASGVVELGEALDEAAEKADDFRAAIEKLLSPALTAQETFDAFKQGILDASEALEENGATLADNTKEGLANREQLRSHIKQMHEMIAANIGHGKSVEETTALMQMARESLIQEADAFGLTRGEAEAYIDALAGTPETLSTLIENPGLAEALLNVKELTLTYDEAGNPVITEFKELGLDSAIINTEGFRALLAAMGIMVIEPEVKPPAGTEEATTAVKELQTTMIGVDGTVAEGTITVKDEGTPVVIDAKDGIEAYSQLEAESVLHADNQAEPVIDEATAAMTAFGAAVGEGHLTVVDDAAPVIDETTVAMTAFGGSFAQGQLAVVDAATPVVDTATTAVVNFGASFAEASINTIDDSTPAVNDALVAITGFGGAFAQANITAVDNSTPVVDAAKINVADFTSLTGMANIGVHDNATPVVDAAEINVTDFTSLTGMASVSATDDSTPVVEGATGALLAFNGTNGTATLNTTGTAQEDIETVTSTAEALNGSTVDVAVQIREAQAAKRSIDALSEAVTAMPKTAVLTFSAPGAATSATSVRLLKQAVDDLAPKTIAIAQTGAQAATTAVKALDKSVDDLKNKMVQINQSGAGVAKSAVDAFDKSIDDLRNKTVTIAQTGAANAQSAVQGLDKAIGALNGKSVNVTANVSGTGAVNDLNRAIGNLSSKSVTVTTRFVTVGGPTMAGGMRQGTSAGEMVTSPKSFGSWTAGERGYHEAVIPMQLPINRIDPSVRHFAELIRGGGTGTTAGPTKIINNTLNVQPVSADPVAVAEQVLNRAASLANR